MARTWTTWWVSAVAASVLAYLALTTYADVFGPGALGLGLRFRRGRVLVVEVVHGSPAATAGLLSGERLGVFRPLTTAISLFPRPMFTKRRGWLIWLLTWAPLTAASVPRLLMTFVRGVYDPARGVDSLSPALTAFVQTLDGALDNTEHATR